MGVVICGGGWRKGLNGGCVVLVRGIATGQCSPHIRSAWTSILFLYCAVPFGAIMCLRLLHVGRSFGVPAGCGLCSGWILYWLDKARGRKQKEYCSAKVGLGRWAWMVFRRSVNVPVRHYSALFRKTGISATYCCVTVLVDEAVGSATLGN